jgi:hypothetical protein
MPYKDESKRKAAQREAQRKRRVNPASTPRQPLPELQELKLESARDVVFLLRAELERFTKTADLGPGERLRGVVGACGTILRAFEQGDLVARLEALEAASAPALALVGGALK